MRMFSCVLVVALACLAPPWASAQDAWETVTSKVGNFTVEMPRKPTVQRTRTRKGPGGIVKFVIVGCTTESGAYFAYKVELPTAIVKGAEDSELDATRDSLAEEWNGKVLSEKHIRAENKVGRDFTIRGKPAEETGVLTIR